MSKDHNSTVIAAKLISNGYVPIPIAAGQKGPHIKQWQKREFTADHFQSDCNVGIRCGDGNVAFLDIDIYCPDYVKAVKDEFMRRFGGRGDWMQRTGQAPKTGLVFRTDIPINKRKQFVKSSGKAPFDDDGNMKREAIEVLGKGNQFVAYGIHPDTQQPYRWHGLDPTDNLLGIVSRLPKIAEVEIEDFLNWVKSNYGPNDPQKKLSESEAEVIQPISIDLGNQSPSRDEVREILSHIPADDYDPWLRILQGLHDLGDHMLGLAIEWSAKSTSHEPGCVEKKWKTFTRGGGITWSTVCVEARNHGADLSEIARKYKGSANEVRRPVAQAGQHAPEVVLTNSPRNTSSVFAMLTKDKSWCHVFALDELKNRPMLIAKPPFQTGDPKYFKPRPLTDTDYTRVRMWIERNWGKVKKEVVIDAVNAASEEQIISPVRHYLEGLPTNNYNIELFFEDYFGVVPENDLHRDFIRSASKLFLKQAVARAVKPGCKADIVVVLEGKQGIGKSSGLRALFGADWFKDSLPPMASKDAADYVVGAWCIELAEMAFQTKAAIEHQKAFISRQEEKYRPAYKRNEAVYPRRCIFVATTNRDDWAIDETGNRRFLPVKTTKIDVVGLKRDRDAIWAAAYASFKHDPMWWMTDEMAAYASEQNKTRHEGDLWVELIYQNMADLNETSISEAFALCFAQTSPDDQSTNPKKIDQKDQRRMSKCLQMAGWEKVGRFTSGARKNQARFIRISEAHELVHDLEF